LKLVEFLRDPRTSFLNLTKATSLFAMQLATKINLGGRDSLIIGCYLHGGVPEIYSHDEDLVKLRKVSLKGKQTRILDPIK